ncbi:MAG: HAD family hydrolase [Promethearchaeota archaeon]
MSPKSRPEPSGKNPKAGTRKPKKPDLVKAFKSGKVRAVVFDFDGTLLDVRPLLKRAIAEVFDHYSIYAEMERTLTEVGAIFEAVQGTPLPRVILQAHEVFGVVSALDGFGLLKKLRVATKTFARYQALEKEAPLFPDVEPLVRALRDPPGGGEPVRLFVVSHNRTASVEAHLERAGLREDFSGVFGADALPALKPDPSALEPVWRASPSLEPAATVVVGDMPTDVELGKLAGTWTVAVTTGVGDRALLESAGADLLVESLDDLRERVTGKAAGAPRKKARAAPAGS